MRCRRGRAANARLPGGTCVKEEEVVKDDLIDVQGTGMCIAAGGYRVQCDAGREVLAQLSGRMRWFRIKAVPGDRVTVGVSSCRPDDDCRYWLAS